MAAARRVHVITGRGVSPELESLVQSTIDAAGCTWTDEGAGVDATISLHSSPGLMSSAAPAPGTQPRNVPRLRIGLFRDGYRLDAGLPSNHPHRSSHTSFVNGRVIPLEVLPTAIETWLALLRPEARVAPQLRLVVERACDEITRLLDEIERLRSTNARLDRRLRAVEAELEQLRLVRDALTAELRKPAGPEPKVSKPLAAAATVMLAVIGGVTSGASQQIVADAMSDRQPAHEVQVDLGPAIEACEQVVVVAEAE